MPSGLDLDGHLGSRKRRTLQVHHRIHTRQQRNVLTRRR